MKLITTRALRYAGKSLDAGEAFECAERDARLLIAVRHAVEAPVDEPAAKPVKQPDEPAEKVATVQRRDLKAEAPKADTLKAADKDHRGYKRRDLKAED